MATRNHSRKLGRRKRQSKQASGATAGSGGASARPEGVGDARLHPWLDVADRGAQINTVLERLKDYLEPVMSTIVVCVGALRNQNAEHDEEIAQVLKSSAGDRLDSLVEGLEKFMQERIQGSASKEAVR